MDSSDESDATVVEAISERLDTLERVVGDFFVDLIHTCEDVDVTVAAGKQLNRLLGVD